MWRIIKADIEREKNLWLSACMPLLLSIFILLYIGSGEALSSPLALKIILNLAKGFAIVIGLLILRATIGYIGRGGFSHHHIRLPVTIVQLGIVRVSNAFSLWVCIFVLLLINFSLLPAQITDTLYPILFFSAGLFLSLFSATIMIYDLLSIWFPVAGYHRFAGLLLVIFLPFLMIPNRTAIMPFITPLNVAILYILGLTLVILNIYTFTRLRSYIVKFET